MNLLIADDDAVSRRLLQEIFAREPNLTLTITSDGAEAWWQLTAPQARFDVAIIDLKMPVVGGLALIERIRQTPHYRLLPVILCTSQRDRNTVAQAVKLQINHYFVKPYRADALRAQVAACAPTHSFGPDHVLISA